MLNHYSQTFQLTQLLKVKNRWDVISKNCNIPLNELTGALELILNSTFFSFDNTMYKQKFGTPMGSPLSPIIADLVMQNLENTALVEMRSIIPFYYRYVNILLAIKE